MAAIDPLTAGAVLLATAATDAVYVMFTSAWWRASACRRRAGAASGICCRPMRSSATPRTGLRCVCGRRFMARAYASITYLHRPPGGPPVGAAPE